MSEHQYYEVDFEANCDGENCPVAVL